MKGFVLVVVLVVAMMGAASANNHQQGLTNDLSPNGPVGQDGVKIDLEHLLRQASTMHNSEQDIEEDQDDRFITKRGGALRELSLDKRGPTEWAEEPSTGPSGLLSRVKRCDNEEDDGDANRARYVRRRRVKQAKVDGVDFKKVKIKKKRAKKTTTVTVIQNGQVVSQTKTTHKPVIQKITTTTTTTTHHVQPVVNTVHHVVPQVAAPVVHQAAPVVHQAAPVVHQAAPAVVVQPPTIV